MTTLKSSVLVAGQVISNNDPQMVITLDAHPSVQIASIQDDSITYEFKGAVTAEALYNLNLTFTYQGKYRVKVPCTFKQTVIQVDYEGRAADLHVKAWDSGNALPFQVWHDGADITSQLTEVTRGAAAEILDYSYAPDTPAEMNKYWWLAQVAVGAEKTVSVPYTFKLPASIDPAQQVRNASGNFVIAAYDGTEIKAEYKDPTPFLVAKGAKKIIFVDVFYKGYYSPAKNVSFLKANSVVTPFTSGATGSADGRRFEIELTAPNAASEQDLKIVLGTSLTNQVEGKNISTVTVPSKIYTAGLLLTTYPNPIYGKTGTEMEVNLVAEADGVVIPNTSLMFEPIVTDIAFVSATEDKVTWRITRTNTTSSDVSFNTNVKVKYNALETTYPQAVMVVAEIMPLDVSTSPNPLVIKYDETANLGVVISRNGENIPVAKPGVIYTFEPQGYLEIITVSPNALVVEAIKEPALEMVPTNMTLTVTDGAETGTSSFVLNTLTNKVKPTMSVVRNITGKRFERGTLPIMVTVGDMDYYYTATNFIAKAGEYVSVDEQGQWVVTNAELSPVSETLQIGFTVTHNGIPWVYMANVTFDIEPSASENVFSIHNEPDFIVAGVGEESTITVYPTILGQASPGQIDVAFSGANAANIVKVKTAISADGKGLDVTYRGVSVLNNGSITATYKIKNLPGETEGTDKVTTTVPLYVFAANKINVIPGTVLPATLTGTKDSEDRLAMVIYRGSVQVPISDSNHMFSVVNGGISISSHESEWVGVRYTGDVGNYTAAFQVYDRTDSSNRAMFDVPVEIVAGPAVRRATWYPIPAEDYPANFDGNITGPVYSYAGSRLGSFSNTNVVIVNDPQNGNAAIDLVGGIKLDGINATSRLKAGHTGDGFVVKSDLSISSLLYKQESRPVQVLQAPWTLVPQGINQWVIDSSVKGKVTEIEFKAFQSRQGVDHYLDQGTFTRLRLSGPALNIGAPRRIAQDTWVVPVTSDGTQGSINVTGQLIEDGIYYPFDLWLYAATKTDVLAMTNVPSNVVVNNHDTYTIPINLTWNGEALPFTTEGIKAVLNNKAVEIVGYDADGLKLFFNSNLHSEFKRYDLKATVMYKGHLVEFTVTVREMLVGKTKPTLTVTGDVTARLNEEGKLPVEIKAGDMDITDLAYEYSTAGGDYIEIANDGTWKIVKEETNKIDVTQPFYINVWYDDVKWSYSPNVTFHIGPDAPAPALTNDNVTLTMDLWETKQVPYTVMLGETDITASVTNVVCTNLETLGDRFEFIDMGNKTWGFKSIKSSPDTTLGTTSAVNITVLHEEVEYVLPMTVNLKTNPNPGTIETQRFKVEAV